MQDWMHCGATVAETGLAVAADDLKVGPPVPPAPPATAGAKQPPAVDGMKASLKRLQTLHFPVGADPYLRHLMDPERCVAQSPRRSAAPPLQRA